MVEEDLIAYVEATPENWNQGAEAMTLTNHVISGKCPACSHEITADIGPAHGVTGFWVTKQAKDTGPMIVEVACNCGFAHPGRPADAPQRGCGAYGGVEVQP